MKKTEQRLKNTMERQVPDVLDVILSRCDTERIGTTMEKKITKRNNSLIKKVTAIAAAVALVLTAGIIAYNANWFGGKDVAPGANVEAVIAFDVNPSLEIEIDKEETVVNVNCLNDDAKKVIGEMELVNVKLDVAVNAIVGSMLKNGYLSVERNSILVSVKSGNHEKAEMLQKDISADIAAMLEAGNIEASVITQKYDDDNGKAEENNISAAKAAFIEKILAAGLNDASGNAYTYERLAAMSVNELKIILDSKEVELENVGTTGSASTNKYITEEKALEIALADAKITADYKSKTEMDYDDGMMLYEVDILHGGYEYEYEINAETGAIVGSEREQSNKNTLDKEENLPVDVFISKEGAVQAAINHAGVAEDTVKGLRTELDTDDGKAHYDIEFVSGDYEYEYEVDFNTGVVIDFEKKAVGNKGEAKPDAPANIIGEASAIEKALAHAGVDSTAATKIKCKLDEENGTYHYDVEFDVGTIEYDYEIDAVSGEILKSEKEEDKENNTATSPENVINKDEAVAKAVAHAGVDNSEKVIIKCELDKDDGKYYYDVEFKVGNVSYEYEIDAVSGKILKSEKELDDDSKESIVQTPTEKFITKDEAFSIACGDAGVKVKDVYILGCELDVENGKYYYDAEFKVGNTEYEYKINAETGEILHKSVEVDDDKPAGNVGVDTSIADISRDEAVALALSNAGTTANAVRELECELDDGRYEVSFTWNGTEYDYVIDPVSEEILHTEKAIDD